MSSVWLRTICPRLPRRRRSSRQIVSPELLESRTLLTASVGIGVRILPGLIGNPQDPLPASTTNPESKTTEVPQNAPTPSVIPTFDFSGKWNYTGENVEGYVIVNQLNKKADTLLRIGDLEFDMKAKIHGDRLTGKFKKTLPLLKINGKFDVTRINSTTFSGTITVKTNGQPTEFLIQGTHV